MEGYEGQTVPVRNLNSGEVTGHMSVQDDFGEYIFWACLENVLSSEPEDMSHVMVGAVSEPGKSRIITKGEASLKIVLDVIAHICSWPLGKVESSAPGIRKESLAWQFFKSFDCSEDLATESKISGSETMAGIIETLTLFKLAVSSTDFSEATDSMEHEEARYIATRWMRKCGIPSILRMIVIKCLLSPRWVYFAAQGPLADLGEATEEPNIRRIKLIRGVMMGDPLTKVLLHVMNIAIRSIPRALCNAEGLSHHFTNSQEIWEASQQHFAEEE
jgi:hypothetical protein